jgi:4-amino-4-deoxy-L-arabinose transferase-like glycosyltransferase
MALPFWFKTLDKRIGFRVVLAIYVLLVAGKLLAVFAWIAQGYGPFLFGDELLYKLNSKAIFDRQSYYSVQYPPLYPLSLALALFSHGSWYTWMLAINCLISSAIVFPVWLIGIRLLPAPMALAATLISALMPYHLIYPRMIMSENLFLPIFLFAVYLVLNSKNKSWLAEIVTGCSLALAYLTRYIFLVAIPVLLVVWWLRARSSDDMNRKSLLGQAHFSYRLLALFVGYLLTYLPWMIYVHRSGYRLTRAFLGSTKPSALARAGSLDSLTMWVSAYVSYVILVIAPYMPLVLLYLFLVVTKKLKNTSEEKAFLILLMGLTGVFLATSIHHSWRASYNRSEPQYLLGRYLVQLTPLFCILGLMTLNKLRELRDRPSVSATVFCSMLSLGSVYLARGVLYGQKVWDLPPWFANIVFNSPDSIVYDSMETTRFVFGVICMIAVLLLIGGVTDFTLNRALAPLLILSIIGIQAISLFSVNRRMHSFGKQGLHARLLVRVLSDELTAGSETITLVNDLDRAGVKNGLLMNGLLLWGIPARKLSIVSGDSPLPGASPGRYKFTDKLYVSPLLRLRYKVDDREYYLYEPGRVSDLRAPFVENWGAR